MFQKKLIVNKTSASKEYELCHHWFFKDIEFKFEKRVSNGCHDLLNDGSFIKKHSYIKCKRCYF